MRRRSCRARAPKSCASEITATGGDGERESLNVRRDGQRERRGALGERIPGRERFGLEAVGAEHLLQHFAAAWRIRADEHAPAERVEVGAERREGFLGARVGAQLARGRRREVVAIFSAVAGFEIRLEGLQRDGLERADVRFQLFRSQEQLIRREDRPLEIVPPVFVALLDVEPVLHECAGERDVAHQHGILRQIVEERRRLFEEERLIKLDARRREAFAHPAIQTRLRRIALEAIAPAAAKAFHAFGVERHFARGQQAHAVERIQRALGFGVEAADGLDVLIEQVDAQRILRAGREHVEQRAAHRELAGARHLADAGVAGFDEPIPERFEP